MWCPIKNYVKVNASLSVFVDITRCTQNTTKTAFLSQNLIKWASKCCCSENKRWDYFIAQKGTKTVFEQFHFSPFLSFSFFCVGQKSKPPMNFIFCSAGWEKNFTSLNQNLKIFWQHAALLCSKKGFFKYFLL